MLSEWTREKKGEGGGKEADNQESIRERGIEKQNGRKGWTKEERTSATGVCRKFLLSPIIIYEADYGSPTMATLKRLIGETVPADVDSSSSSSSSLSSSSLPSSPSSESLMRKGKGTEKGGKGRRTTKERRRYSGTRMASAVCTGIRVSMKLRLAVTIIISINYAVPWSPCDRTIRFGKSAARKTRRVARPGIGRTG